MLRWFLIVCATLVSGWALSSCGNLHQVANIPGGLHVQWWLILTGLMFLFFCIKVKK